MTEGVGTLGRLSYIQCLSQMHWYLIRNTVVFTANKCAKCNSDNFLLSFTISIGTSPKQIFSSNLSSPVTHRFIPPSTTLSLHCLDIEYYFIWWSFRGNTHKLLSFTVAKAWFLFVAIHSYFSLSYNMFHRKRNLSIQTVSKSMIRDKFNAKFLVFIESEASLFPHI